MKKTILLLAIVVMGVLAANYNVANASGFVHIRGISYPLEKDYLLTSSNDEVTLKIFATSTKQSLTLKMMTIARLENINNFFTLPKNTTAASDLFFIKFTPTETGTFTTQPELTIRYESDDHYKEAYFYDWIHLKFVKLESVRSNLNNSLTVKLPDRKKIMIALFNEPELVGKASWYVYPKYRGELIAASRDFAIDSKVKVTNLYNNWETIVTIKDYGPKLCSDWTDKEQRLMGPCQERVLDLSKTAFLELATTTGVGIISNVKVTPIIEITQ